MERLTAMGLTRVFNCWWFALLLGLLAASLFVCTWRRAITATRVAKHLRGRVIGSVVTHVSMLLILCGGVISTLWGVHGGMDLRVGHTYGSFSAGGGEEALPFKVHLVDFKIELYGEDGKEEQSNPRQPLGKIDVRWPAKKLACELPAELGVPHTLHTEGGSSGHFVVTVKKFLSDFVIDPVTQEKRSRSSRDDNPAVLVSVVSETATNETWLFAKYPDFNKHVGPADGPDANPLELAFKYERDSRSRGGSIKDYKSQVQILENGTVVLEKTIEVNSPLAWKGYRFYQSGYNPEDPSWTSFQVVRDPGVSVVFVGFALMIAGMTAVFYINPWLASRAKKAERKT
jgi:hypothetical protein